MVTKSLRIVLLAVMGSSHVGAQVATVKASVGPMAVRGGCHGIDSKYSAHDAALTPPLGSCVITGGRLSHLILIAWDLHNVQLIKSDEEWIAGGSERFNIEASAKDAGSATEEQLLHMLQTVVIDRFQLKFHRETVEKPGFALLVAKNGPKLHESPAGKLSTFIGGDFRIRPTPGQPTTRNGLNCSMELLASTLSNPESKPVIDKTGLSGGYDFKLAWDDNAGPSLATVLEEQLGLRLEPQTVPVSFFVVDSARRPDGN
jgi:uncharacterized protein (TIGR03435 family)